MLNQTTTDAIEELIAKGEDSALNLQDLINVLNPNANELHELTYVQIALNEFSLKAVQASLNFNTAKYNKSLEQLNVICDLGKSIIALQAVLNPYGLTLQHLEAIAVALLQANHTNVQIIGV